MEIYLFGILVVMLVFSGVIGGLGILIYLGAPKRRPVNASHLNLPYPSNAQVTINRLSTLGFHRLGETYTQMPLAMSPGPTWIFINESMTTQAEIVEIDPGVFFTTFFANDSVVETGFPLGEDITTQNFLSQTVTSNVDDAIHQHLLNVDEFQTTHGNPQLIHNMDDYLHWDEIYRIHHAKRKMQRVFLIDLTRVLALLYGIVISIVVWQLWQRHAPVPQWVTDWDRGLFLLLAPAFCISALSTLVSVLGSRRNKKRARAG
jgi:hypothetical protein